MRSAATLATLFLLVAPALSAPFAPQPRGASQWLDEAGGAAKIALNRVKNSKTLANALEHLRFSGSLGTMTESQADTLLNAAKAGDSKAIAAIDNLAADYAAHAKLTPINSAGKELLAGYRMDAGKITSTPFKANKVDAGLVKAGSKVAAVPKAAAARWAKLSTAQKVAVIVAGTVGTGAVLGTALELEKSTRTDEYDYPSELSQDDMDQIEAYIQENPDEYAELIADIQENVPGVTEEQMEELTALAPPDVVSQAGTSSSSKHKSESSDDDDN